MCRPDDYPPFTSVEVAALRAVVEFEPNTERVIEDDEVRATIQTVFGLTTDEIARAIAVADMHDPHWRDGPLAAARAAARPVTYGTESETRHVNVHEASPDPVAGLREAAQAVMDVADYYTSEDDDSDPLWDHIPVELTAKLDALRDALLGLTI